MNDVQERYLKRRIEGLENRIKKMLAGIEEHEALTFAILGSLAREYGQDGENGEKRLTISRAAVTDTMQTTATSLAFDGDGNTIVIVSRKGEDT